MRSHYILAYDISDPSRLRRVARIAEDFGERVQLSVFACQLTTRDIAILRERLKDAIKPSEDQVIIVRLGPVADTPNERPEFETLGRPAELRDMRAMIF